MPEREGWNSFVHPEGQPYYQSQLGGILYTTEADVCDEEVYKEITGFITELEKRISTTELNSTNDLEIVLDVEGEWSYYIIDHTCRHILWLENHDANYLVNTLLVGGIPSFSYMSERFDLLHPK